MGQVVTNRLAEKWDELYDRGAEYDRHVAGIEHDITHILQASGHSAPREQAVQCIEDWTARGMLVRQAMPEHFVTMLMQVREAVHVFSSGLWKGTEPYEELGRGWIECVGQLTEWATAFDMPKWVSKSDQFSGAGPFTYLA